MPLPTFADEFAAFPAGWDHVRRTQPGWPHLEEAAALAADYVRATAGSTLVHTDARDDNFLLVDGAALLCDWNFPVVGAAWIDTVCLLIVCARRRGRRGCPARPAALTREVDPGDVDVLLALLCGYFLERRDRPAPYSSPYLRRHQDWCAEVCWAWLARRRGWE